VSTIFWCFSISDFITSLLDLRLVDPGSTLIHVGACDTSTLVHATLNVI